ncbi:MAG TPA: hypothetical protein VJ804_15175 [Acidimicrobiales bacterium]|nr:hypothetical protein [Acidimicrobiales bacterium]
MSVVAEEPPEGADDWTEDQWREWLAAAPPDPDTGRAHPLTRAVSSGGGSVLGAAMSAVDEAIFGERHKAEIVAEVPGDALDDGELALDLDDPSRSRIALDGG